MNDMMLKIAGATLMLALVALTPNVTAQDPDPHEQFPEPDFESGPYENCYEQVYYEEVPCIAFTYVGLWIDWVHERCDDVHPDCKDVTILQ